MTAHQPRPADMIAGSHGLPSSCGSSQTSMTSAIDATTVRSSTSSPVARAHFGRGVCGDSPTVVLPSGGPSDLGLVGLTCVCAPDISNDAEDVATGVDGNGMPASDDCVPPGSGSVGSSTRGCFAELSSSGRRGDLSCTTPGFSDFVAASGAASVPPLDANQGVVPVGPNDGFTVSAWYGRQKCIPDRHIHRHSGPCETCLSSFPQFRHGVQSMSAMASADQILSSVNLRTARVRKTPALLTTVCSSV